MHLSDEQIQRMLHGEFDASSMEALTQHTVECAACARALEDAAREEAVVFELLHEIDHPAPAVDAAVIAGSRRTSIGVWGRRAAVVAVVAALGGAAYAIPGSPVRDIVKRMASLVAERPTSSPVGAPPADQPVTSGISVPESEHFAIHFTSEQDSGDVAVSWTGGDAITVRARGGRASFTTDAGRLIIDNEGSTANYDIEVSRDVYSLEITCGSRTLLRREGENLQEQSAGNARGRLVFSLAPPATTGE